MELAYVLILLTVVAISIRTFSYGIWVWKKGLKAGAAGVFIVAALSVLVPVGAYFYLK